MAPASAAGLQDAAQGPAAPVQWCPAAGLCAERPAHEAEPALHAQVSTPYQPSLRAQSFCWLWALQDPWLHQGLLGCCLQCQPVASPTCMRISRVLIAGTMTTLCQCQSWREVSPARSRLEAPALPEAVPRELRGRALLNGVRLRGPRMLLCSRAPGCLQPPSLMEPFPAACRKFHNSLCSSQQQPPDIPPTNS